MKNPIKILVFAGSSREKSYNKSLAKIAVQIGQNLGENLIFIDLKDFPMPLYNADLEEKSGLPENAIKLQNMFLESHALFIACPEYNSSITPLLKNTLDWVSRPRNPGESDLAAYKGKVAALCSASPGQLGGLRSLTVVRMMLSNIGVLVIPNYLTIPTAYDAFDDQGKLKSEDLMKRLHVVVQQLINTTKSLQVD